MEKKPKTNVVRDPHLLTSVDGAGKSGAEQQEKVKAKARHTGHRDRIDRPTFHKSGIRTQVTPKVWAEISELYELGALPVRDLAARYDVSESNIKTRMKKDGAVYGIRAAEQTRQAIADLDDDISLVMSRAKETKDDHYKWSTLLAKLAVKKIHNAETREGGYDYETAEQEIRTLSLAMKVTGDARKERYAILGLDKEDLLGDELPELRITEMDEIDLIDIRQAQTDKLKSTGGLARDLLDEEDAD